MSPAKKGSRFSYLTSATESSETQSPQEEGSRQGSESDSLLERGDSLTEAESSEGGEGGRSRTRQRRSSTRASTRDDLASVPKGQGRMKQERSQLNVRLPTTLKRQASAKAVLEGKDIGEVVEELLREYLER
jgi:hypothetical protein